MSSRDELLDLVLARARECLENPDSRQHWETGARLLEQEAKIRKLAAETPPDAATVTAATSLARALIEGAVADGAMSGGTTGKENPLPDTASRRTPGAGA